MFRRRLFPPPPPGGRLLVRQALLRAHQALERGDSAQAVEIFQRLADGAERHGMPARASSLRLQAAIAQASGGQAGAAVEEARRALAGFAQQPIHPRVAATAERLVTLLRQGGHASEAARVEQALEETLRRAGLSRQALTERFAAARGQQRGQLPAKCPSCAAPLLPDEVEWHGPDTAECPYCSAAVKTA